MMRTDDVVVRLGSTGDFPGVVELYREWGYRGGVQPRDRLIIAEHDGQIVGVVRLTREHGHTMLRGMRVQPPYQRSGVGTRMLRLFEQQLSDECLCVPFAHLLGFYGQIGFREISRDEAPRFLADRARSYEAEGHRVAIMRRPG
jgi:N-acetylglutamate synthase-like GNAT family acetyltransferase